MSDEIIFAHGLNRDYRMQWMCKTHIEVVIFFLLDIDADQRRDYRCAEKEIVVDLSDLSEAHQSRRERIKRDKKERKRKENR